MKKNCQYKVKNKIINGEVEISGCCIHMSLEFSLSIENEVNGKLPYV